MRKFKIKGRIELLTSLEKKFEVLPNLPFNANVEIKMVVDIEKKETFEIPVNLSESELKRETEPKQKNQRRLKSLLSWKDLSADALLSRML